LKNNNSIFITGFSGFIGKNILNSFESIFYFKKYIKGGAINIEQDVVLHLAGKAHDIRSTSDPLDYYIVNTKLTKDIFDAFLLSTAKVFITISSVKAVADHLPSVLTEDTVPNPTTHYGKSKLLAEEYITEKSIPDGKRVFILRPCMIHGPENKGNLNLLFHFVSYRIPWFLGSYENKRSYCSIQNLCFVIYQLIINDKIPSGIYNVSDDEPLSTNELIGLIAKSQNSSPKVWSLSKKVIEGVSFIGDKFHLPLNTERLQKLTTSYIVSNAKIKAAIGIPFPVSSREGLLKTFTSFNS